MPYVHFSNLPTVNCQCSKCIGTLTSLTMWMEVVAVNCNWSVRRGGGGSVAVTLHYLWQGSQGERRERPSRHYKETELGHKLPAELSLISQTFNLVYVCCKEVGSPHKLKQKGPVWVVFKQEFSLWILSHGQEFFALRSVIHEMKGWWRRQSFMIRSLASWIQMQETHCVLNSLFGKQDIGPYSHFKSALLDFSTSLEIHFTWFLGLVSLSPIYISFPNWLKYCFFALIKLKMNVLPGNMTTRTQNNITLVSSVN